MDPAGGPPEVLFAGSSDDAGPAWSPNETQVGFLQRPDGAPAQLWLVDVGTRNATPLSPPSLDVKSFDFSPEGEWLVFSADEDGRHSLWIVDRDGGQLERLTDQEGVDDVDPVWRPEP